MTLHAVGRLPVIVVAQSGAAQTLTGSTSETTLATITIPAGVLGPNGQVEVEALWSCTNSANNKTCRVKFGGTAFTSAVLTTSAGVQTHTRIANRNATNSQVSLGATAVTGFGGTSATATTGAVDTTADVTLLLTGQLASAAETLTLESYVVTVRPSA